MTLDRRELLKYLATLQIVATLPMVQGCSSDKLVPDGAPFSLWRRIRDAVRQSPDHLNSRARDAVASQDLNTIFEFVRDNVALRPWAAPAHAVQIQSAGYAGRRGVLRSGIATAREKAELLHHLLTEAGFDADIVDGNVNFDAVGGTALFSNQDVPTFEPDATIAPIDDWLAELGLANSNGIREANLEASGLDEFADRLLNAIPVESRGGNTDWSALTTWLPLVRVKTGGSAVFANPNVLNASLGPHYCEQEPRPSPVQEPVPTPNLKLTLSMTRQQALTRDEPILEGQWPIGDLIGRRVQIRFLPTQESTDLLAMPLHQLRTFQAAFMVAGNDIDEEEALTLGFSGDVITLDGDRISADGDNQVIGENTVRLGDADPALAAAVERVDMVVNASEFPRIRVEAGLYGAGDAQINGLPSSSFGMSHSDQPVSAVLKRNLPEAPRIAFVMDFSTSLPEGYRRTGLIPLVDRICRDVASASIDAIFRAGSFSGAPLGSSVDWFGGWLEKPEQIVDAIQNGADSASDSSSYFKSLADATNSDANLVVLITDADGSGNETAEYSAMISSGCPAVIIALPSALSRTEHFQRLAELSGGHLFFEEQLDNAVATINDLAAAGKTRPYLFEFVAGEDDNTEPVVSLALTSSLAREEARYERPDHAVSSARSIAGLFLTVELGNRRITRRIAGYPRTSASVLSLDEDHLASARLSLLGRFDLSVEAAAPTAAVALDDTLSAQLSCESLVTAASARDEQQINEAAAGGFVQIPKRWLALNTPLPNMDREKISFQAGYRMILFSDIPDPAGHYRRKVDVLPFSDWRTVAPAQDEFAATIRHSLQLTLLEAENFPHSTAAIAGDTGYELVPSFQMSAWANTVKEPSRNKIWQVAVADRNSAKLPHQLLVPANSSALAYWEIDTRSGSVLGLLPDSSGGATVEDTNRKFEMLARVIDAYSEIMQALVAAPPGFKVWVELEKAKLEHLRRATIAIILMDGTHTSGYGDLLEEQVQGWITDQIQDAIDSGLGEAIAGYDELQEAIGWHNKVQQLWETAATD